MAKKHFGKYAVVLFITMVILTACKSMPDSKSASMKDDGMKMKKGMELAAWKGEWLSADILINDSSLEPLYRETAAEMPHYTAEGFESAVAKMYKVSVYKVKFNGTNTVLFTVKDAGGSEKEISCEYMYKGKVPVPGFDGYFWETFEAVKDVRGLSKVKYMALLLPHKHGDGILHWHGRFGGRDIDSLVQTNDAWWPAFVLSSITNEELLKNTIDGIKAIPQFLPKSPFESYAEKGRWLNAGLIYDNDSAEVNAVYEKLIKEFAGKNPKGGDFTKAEIIAEMKKVYGAGEDFTYLEFVTEGGKNELAVYKGDKEVFRSPYKRTADSGIGAFTAVADKKGGKFNVISFTGAHGDPAHFHLWYGAAEKDLRGLTIKPTCIPADTPNAKVAVRVEGSCRRTLQSIIQK